MFFGNSFGWFGLLREPFIIMIRMFEEWGACRGGDLLSKNQYQPEVASLTSAAFVFSATPVRTYELNLNQAPGLKSTKVLSGMANKEFTD
jgi:hypothetical protein